MNAPQQIDPLEIQRRRRQRMRNIAVFTVLAAVVVLVYAVTIVKIRLGYRP